MPQLIEEPPTSFAQDRPPSFARRLAHSTIRFVVVLGIAAAIGGSWYMARKGFGRQWRARVVEELHRRGVEAAIGHLTLDPFRGLVARNVRIFTYKNRSETLAYISEISLDINYAAFFHHQPFLNALDIRNAEITLPLKGREGKIDKPQLTKFRAHIYFPPEEIEVSQAEGIFCGIRMSATGQLIKRADYRASPPLSDEERERRMALLRRGITELQQFTFPNGPPSLQVKFSGDLARLEDARVEASLRGQSLKRKNYEIRDLVASAEWSNQTLELRQLEWKDHFGNFAASATWRRQGNNATFQARSSVDLKGLLDAAGLGKPLADTTFNSPINLELSGSANLSGEHPQIKTIGHATIANFSYRNVPLSDFRTEFSWDGERTWFRELRVRHQTGELQADIFSAPDDSRLDLNSSINPGALRVIGSPELTEFLKDWEWERSPVIHLAIRGTDRRPKGWHGEGTLAMERTRFRGVLMNSATANVRFADGAVTYDNFRIIRDEGVGTGNFTYDFAKHEVRISNIKSNLKTDEVVFWIDPDLWKTVVPYKFRQPPNITANGVYQFAGGKGTKLEINVDGQAGMHYVFLGKTLPFDRIAGRLLFTNDRLQINDLHGSIFSGNVRGNADISLAHGDQHYKASIVANAVDFPHLTELYWNYKTAQGQLSGNYDFTGVGSETRKMQGTGKLTVTNGDVFAIPVFGPISGILGSLLPGTAAGYSIAHQATASYTIKNGVIHTEDFEVSGKLFSMLGRGDLHFMDDKLDFDIRIAPKGAGVLLTPVYKLFEYHGEGSLKNPDWHPKRF